MPSGKPFKSIINDGDAFDDLPNIGSPEGDDGDDSEDGGDDGPQIENLGMRFIRSCYVNGHSLAWLCVLVSVLSLR